MKIDSLMFVPRLRAKQENVDDRCGFLEKAEVAPIMRSQPVPVRHGVTGLRPKKIEVDPFRSERNLVIPVGV